MSEGPSLTFFQIDYANGVVLGSLIDRWLHQVRHSFNREEDFMGTSKHFFTGLMLVTFVCGSVGLLLPPLSQADVQFGGIKPILKKIFPPCGPGTRKERFVVKGETVCDNKTGLWWEQSPSSEFFTWQEAIDHCATLELTGNYHQKKEWRLAEVKELQSLVDYSVPDQATNLNDPNGPFMNVRPEFYWSATELAGDPSTAWDVAFFTGLVLNGDKAFNSFPAWCVSGDKDAH